MDLFCISPFGRGGGGKSLFRKTFGSLEKPSQRLEWDQDCVKNWQVLKVAQSFSHFFIQSTAHSPNTHQSGAICWDGGFWLIPGRAGERETRPAAIGWHWLPLAPIGRYCQGPTSRGIECWDTRVAKKCPILYGRKQTNRQTRYSCISHFHFGNISRSYFQILD